MQGWGGYDVVPVAAQLAVVELDDEAVVPRLLVAFTPAVDVVSAVSFGRGEGLGQSSVGTPPIAVGALLIEVPHEQPTRNLTANNANREVSIVRVSKPLIELRVVR